MGQGIDFFDHRLPISGFQTHISPPGRRRGAVSPARVTMSHRAVELNCAEDGVVDQRLSCYHHRYNSNGSIGRFSYNL